MTSHFNFFVFYCIEYKNYVQTTVGTISQQLPLSGQCLPETLKCLGFPNQKKQTQHLTKQLHCWIHLCARTKLVLQSCGGQFFSHRAIADSLPPFFNLDFGTYSLPLTIIISTIFKRLGVQINSCSHN